jgi:hypothetical protein
VFAEVRVKMFALFVQLRKFSRELHLKIDIFSLTEQLFGRREPFIEGISPRHRRHHRIDQRAFRQRLEILRQIPDARLAAEGHGAAISVHLPHQNLQHRRLAGAVGSDETDAISGTDREGAVVKQRLRPV